MDLDLTQGQKNVYVIKMTTQIETSFMLGEKKITIQQTRRKKYVLEMDNNTYYLSNAQQIRGAINSTGRFISLNGVYMELGGRERGTNKQKKLTDVKISKIPRPPKESPVSPHH